MPDICNETTEPFFIEGLQTESGVPLILDEVVDADVFVRQVDPGDDPSVRVRLGPGQRIVQSSPVGSVAIHLTEEEEEGEDAIYWLRVVFDRREPGVVYARTPRFGESDDGRRVHVRPNERFELPQGAIQISLDGIEQFYRDIDPERPQGSTAAVVRVWHKTAGIEPPQLYLVAQAAAHRLDSAAHLLPQLLKVDGIVRSDEVRGPRLVAAIDEYVHLVQAVVVALARCIALIDVCRTLVPFEVRRSEELGRHGEAVKAIRDAYEHIDERAFGRARRAVDIRTLTIFDHSSLVREGVIAYIDHRLAVAELPSIASECRETIKAMIGGPPSPIASN